jgi:hypothetical protein
VLLDRPKAAGLPAGAASESNGKNDYNAEWRIARVAVRRRQPDADEKLKTFLLKYPVSANAVDALYWLGRFRRTQRNPAHARSFYNKAMDRFPETYFGFASGERLSKLGPVRILQTFWKSIPPPPPLRPLMSRCRLLPWTLGARPGPASNCI